MDETKFAHGDFDKRGGDELKGNTCGDGHDASFDLSLATHCQ